MTPYNPTAASSIAAQPTAVTSHTLARTGNSVVATSAALVWFSMKTRFGSSDGHARRVRPIVICESAAFENWHADRLEVLRRDRRDFDGVTVRTHLVPARNPDFPP